MSNLAGQYSFSTKHIPNFIFYLSLMHADLTAFTAFYLFWLGPTLSFSLLLRFCLNSESVFAVSLIFQQDCIES